MFISFTAQKLPYKPAQHTTLRPRASSESLLWPFRYIRNCRKCCNCSA